MKKRKGSQFLSTLRRVERKCDTIEDAVLRIGCAVELAEVIGRMARQANVMKKESCLQRAFYEANLNGAHL